jgi:exonuclease SbcD
MAVHFFHTSDWHLGQFFHNQPRHYEHQQFLTWLTQQIRDKQPDALLIAGDVFDVINPSAQAQKQLYQFLADIHQVAPAMQTLLIAGNHDSGYRIEQVEPLLAKYNAKAVGILQKDEHGQLDLKHLLVPIYNAEQKLLAWCVALPFLRPAEITSLPDLPQDSQAAIAHLHQTIIHAAKQQLGPDQALILMSHAHLQGATSSDSERPIIIGNEEALSVEIFDPQIDYVALGHLHKPQQVSQPHIRYCGSPIPLSFSEINYRHQIVEVHIDPQLAQPSRFRFQPLYIPRAIALHRLKGELQQVLHELAQLDATEIAEFEQRDYLSIEYYSETPPPPNLRQQFEQHMPANRYRLLQFSRSYQADRSRPAQPTTQTREAPSPRQLFLSLWQQQGYQADAAVEQDFLSLLAEAEQALDHKQPE